MDRETEPLLENLRGKIRLAASRVMELALHQALLARLGSRRKRPTGSFSPWREI
jgi:hypothetical protein